MGKISFKFVLILLKVLFFSNTFFAQNIEGVVKTTQDVPLENASIILKNSENKTLSYQFAKADGTFRFTGLETGTYILQCNAAGYEKLILTIALTKDDTKKVTAELAEKTEELQEMVIDLPAPIKQKKDTVTFNVKAFTDGTEYTLEDLLRKLPGIQVTENGTVKVGNQEIEKIMVEGDDFFEKGYKVLSKNMPVKPLREVELLKNYSHNKHLKGIENSDKVSLNLKLEDDAKRQWFGNVEAGYGVTSENRYTLRGNLMNFGRKNKYYFLTNLNNLGYDATGDINHLIRPETEFTIGNNLYSEQLLNLSPSTAALRDDRTRFNNTEMLSVNSIFTLSDKTKLKAIAFLNTDGQNFFRKSFDRFYDGATTFENTENYYMRQKRFSAFGKVNLTHDFSKKATLEFTTRFNYADNSDRSYVNFNGLTLEEYLNTNTNFVDSEISYTVTPSESKVWILTGRLIKEEAPQRYHINRFVYQDLFKQDAQAVSQTSEDKMFFYGFEAKYLDRRPGGHLFEFNTGVNEKNNDLTTAFYLINEHEAPYGPEGFQNRLKLQQYSYYSGLSYLLHLNNNFSIIPSFKVNLMNQRMTEIHSKKQSAPLLLSPALHVNWEVNSRNKLQAAYRYNRQTSPLTSLYPQYIHSGFRSFSAGYGNFTEFTTHNGSLNYSLGNWSDRFFMSASTGYSFSERYFSTSTVMSQNYSVTIPVVLNNRSMVYYNLSTDYYFKHLKSNFKATLTGNRSKYQNYVNQSDIRDITAVSFNYGLEIRSGFRGIFNYHIGTIWDYTQFKTITALDYTNNRTFLNLSFRFSKELNATLHNERYFFGNLSQAKKEFYFSDINLAYQPIEKLRLTLVINNLFNTDSFVSYSISDISFSETSYRLIPRYALLKAEYRF